MRPTARALLRSAGVPSLLVTDCVNIRYLTGSAVSSGFLLAAGGRYTLFVDGRYSEQARDEVSQDVRVEPMDRVAAAVRAERRTGFESRQVSVATLGRFRRAFRGTALVPVAGAVEKFRRQKSSEELRLLRAAERRTRALLRAAAALLKPGVTEAGLAWMLRAKAVADGAEDLSFEPIVAFAEHTSRPHHHPTARALRRGDVVQLDIGVRYRGYCGDLSEVLFTAPKKPEERDAYRALKQAKKAAIERIRPGAAATAVDEAARAVLRARGLEEAFVHALGHGVGLEVHEGITLSPRAKGQRLLRSEVVTVEPGVYFPGRFGMRLEDMVTVE